MIYFWLIPLLLFILIAMVFLFRGSKRSTRGTSRLDEAINESKRDLRE